MAGSHDVIRDSASYPIVISGVPADVMFPAPSLPVSRSATSSVVLSSLFLILADVLLVQLILEFFRMETQTNPDSPIAVTGLRKTFGGQKVPDGITFELVSGQVNSAPSPPARYSAPPLGESAPAADFRLARQALIEAARRVR